MRFAAGLRSSVRQIGENDDQIWLATRIEVVGLLLTLQPESERTRGNPSPCRVERREK